MSNTARHAVCLSCPTAVSPSSLHSILVEIIQLGKRQYGIVGFCGCVGGLAYDAVGVGVEECEVTAGVPLPHRLFAPSYLALNTTI
jgi:hypothetical protein